MSRWPARPGHIVAKIGTPAGAIVIGGKGPNTYYLDSMGDVAAVINLGGDNTYYDGTVSIDRPLLVNINLGGHNVYRSTKPAVQAGAILGVSMIVNAEGGNRYEAEDMAQASAIGGVGIIVEFGGDNVYRGVDSACRPRPSAALGSSSATAAATATTPACGARDSAARWASASSTTSAATTTTTWAGFTSTLTSRETPGYEGFGQGVGGGIRQVACGGIGMLLNGGGHNVYEFDYLAHGGGYWCGLGFARDFGGYSKRLIARKNFYGGERTETAFPAVRLSAGAATMPWASASTTKDTARSKAASWAAAWAGTARSAPVRLRRQQPLRRRPEPRAGQRLAGQPWHPLPIRR